MSDVRITIDGREVRVPRGTTIAVALLQAGCASFRRSVLGAPRSPLCGMGICFECRVTIDGRAQCLSCQTLCEEGTEVTTSS
jgi:predicted molibdopterin-dependent oxidoreductase YjgC